MPTVSADLLANAVRCSQAASAAMADNNAAPDAAFIPFNFSSVVPYDALAAALTELPLPQPREPAGEFSQFLATETVDASPSVATQMEMIRLMADTAREGSWHLTNEGESLVDTTRPSGKRKVRLPFWLPPFCERLPSELANSDKRPRTPTKPPSRRTTPKRPRHVRHPIAQSAIDAEATQPLPAPKPAVPQPQLNASQSLSTEEALEHEKRMEQMSKDVDLDECNDFVHFLESFVRRPDAIARKTDSPDDAVLHTTSNVNVMTELRQKVAFHAQQGIVAHVPPPLLSRIIFILQTRVRESARECNLAEGHSETAVFPGLLGVMAGSTILTILSAPNSPRKLLVEELLDEIVGLLRGVSLFVIFPIFDPMYRASKHDGMRGGGKGEKNVRKAGASGARNRAKASTGDNNDTAMKSSRPVRRPLNRKDQALLEQCSTLYDSWAMLFWKEKHLPDSVVSLCANICVQSIRVTGISRLQAFAMKTVSTIFSSYPVHRLTILDEVREAASIIPAMRKSLRCFKIPGEQTEIRVSSAMLAQLLCLASKEGSNSTADLTKDPMVEDEQAWCVRQRKRHDRAAKMAMHVLEPILNRAYIDREAEYRTAFQALLEDILILYGKPEWPSAELMLQTMSVSIITRLRASDDKTVYVRSVCIDILGALAAKMCNLYGNDVLKTGAERPTLSSIGSDFERQRETLLLFLSPEASLLHDASHSFYEALFITDDCSFLSSLEGANELLTAKDGAYEECVGTGEAEVVLDSHKEEIDAVSATFGVVERNARKRARNAAGKRQRKETVMRKDAVIAARWISMHRGFAGGFMTILEAILDGMHDSAPTVRAKSIKALTAVDESCHGLLRALPNVLSYIEASCRDVSTLARDAALELLSRSLWESETSRTKRVEGSVSLEDNSNVTIPDENDFFMKVFSIVEKRLCDTSTSVRKRAISIMRSVLSEALRATAILRRNPMKSVETMRDGSVHEHRVIQICASLVARLDDPETSVRKAAERALRLGLFGFDMAEQNAGPTLQEASAAALLAERFITVFARLPSSIHLNFMSRVVHEAMLIKHMPLLSAIMSAAVEQLHGYDAKMASLTGGRSIRSLPAADAKRLKALSIRRVACSSVICAFGGLDASLITPHCRALAPSIAGVSDGAISENDLLCVQRILNALEIGLGMSADLDAPFLKEILHEVDAIVCQSPIHVLEEASVRCLCVVARKSGTSEAQELLFRAANNFKTFLKDQLEHIREYCGKELPEKPSAMERNARGAVVRLGLLARYGQFSEDFIADVYETLEATCEAVCAKVCKRDLLARSSVRALFHFVIRHRAFLARATDVFLSLLSSSQTETVNSENCAVGSNSFCQEKLCQAHVCFGEGVQLYVIQGFHELLRDEEERNSTKVGDHAAKGETREVQFAQGAKPKSTGHEPNHEPTDVAKDDTDDPVRIADQPVLAAEEDADAGYLAVSAQALIPKLMYAALSPAVSIRRTVANIFGLLVRQGLVLPATVVPSLFSLLLDQDSRCREYSYRVVAFLADRHSGMLASAALPALRLCFEMSLPLYLATCSEEQKSESCRECTENDDETSIHGSGYCTQGWSLTAEKIEAMTVDKKSGLSLLSQAVMAMRRDQRRGVLEGLIREFDPRVVLRFGAGSECANGSYVRVNDVDIDVIDVVNTPSKSRSQSENDVDVDDDVGQISAAGLEFDSADNLCPLPTLCFLAYMLATVDFTNGAGLGGSLNRGGGTVAADTKLKFAREDVGDLVGIATRIISNSGQAILRVTKQLLRNSLTNEDKKARIALCASRISLLLSLKHHLKVERWKSPADYEELENEGVDLPATNFRMPKFRPGSSALRLVGMKWGEGDDRMSEAVDEQLHVFRRLMRDDAIDDADVMTSRRTPRSSHANTSRKKKSSTRKSGTRRGNKNGNINSVQTGNTVRQRRHSGTPRRVKRLRYDDETDDGGSDYEPVR